MRTPLVSIIIPVYNVDKYLCQCLESVISQTYKNWELILVDDGSKDNSPVICDNYALKDSRIKVWHKKNTGVSDSRNIALRSVKGYFTMFIDGDDYLCDEKAIEQLVKLAVENKLDIVRGEYKMVNEQNVIIDSFPRYCLSSSYCNMIINGFEFFKNGIKNDFFIFLSLFKTEKIKKIQFEKGQIFLEDMRFYSQLLLLQGLKCMYVPSISFYAYRKHDESISNKLNPNKIKDSFNMCYFFHDTSLKTDNKKLKLYFQKWSLTIYKSTLKTLAYYNYYNNYKKYIIDFNVTELRHSLLVWMREYNYMDSSLLCYISPYWGIKLLRLRFHISRIKIFIKKLSIFYNIY